MTLMDKTLSIFIDSLPHENVYVLVQWPWVQELMEYGWFRKECYLHQAFDGQPYPPSAYFVPIGRIHALPKPD
jgi:hypothetical protein